MAPIILKQIESILKWCTIRDINKVTNATTFCVMECEEEISPLPKSCVHAMYGTRTKMASINSTIAKTITNNNDKPFLNDAETGSSSFCGMGLYDNYSFMESSR